MDYIILITACSTFLSVVSREHLMPVYSFYVRSVVLEIQMGDSGGGNDVLLG